MWVFRRFGVWSLPSRRFRRRRACLHNSINGGGKGWDEAADTRLDDVDTDIIDTGFNLLSHEIHGHVMDV